MKSIITMLKDTNPIIKTNKKNFTPCINKQSRSSAYLNNVNEKGEQDIITLDEWNPYNLPDHFFIVVEGKRRTGKSTFVRWLLQYYTETFSLVWCMSETLNGGPWIHHIGSQWTFDKYDPFAIDSLIKRNDNIIQKYGEYSKESKTLGSTLVILDDVITKDFIYDESFARLAATGRHHLISVIIIVQDPKAIGPKIRDNADLAVIFRQKTERCKDTIWKDFMNDIDKDSALALLDKYSVNHDCLICNQTNLDGVLTNNYMKSQFDKTNLVYPDYTMGSKTQKMEIIKEREIKKARDKQIAQSLKRNKKPLKDRIKEEDVYGYTSQRLLNK